MYQLITKSHQNICCLPIIDIEEKLQKTSDNSLNVNHDNEKINLSEKKEHFKESKKNETEPKNETMLEEKRLFIPKALMCFSDGKNKLGLENKVGVTFAQEAQNYHKKICKSENVFKPLDKDIKRKKIYVRNLEVNRTIPIVSTGISGSRYIYDNNSLLDYCMKWCKSVYFGRVVLRAIHNTGTLLLIFPGKAMHFIQFLYGKAGRTEAQRKFQDDIFPVNVLEFHSFSSFSNWMKKQIALDS